jgi:hypothetical protein
MPESEEAAGAKQRIRSLNCPHGKVKWRGQDRRSQTRINRAPNKRASSLPPLVEWRLRRLENEHLAFRLRKPTLEGDHPAVAPFAKLPHGEEGWWEKTYPRRAGRTAEHVVAPRVR